MALCTQTDVEQRLQIDFTNAADPVCASLIAAAQGHIEREVGYPLEAATGIVEVFDAYRNTMSLFLSRRPVTAITTVVEDGVTLAAADYLLYAPGRLIRRSGDYASVWLGGKPQVVSVTYSAGYTVGTMPKDLVDICAWSAARAFQIGAAFAGMSVDAFIESISLAGSDSVSYRDVTGTLTGHVALTPQDLDACHAYRIPAIA